MSFCFPQYRISKITYLRGSLMKTFKYHYSWQNVCFCHCVKKDLVLYDYKILIKVSVYSVYYKAGKHKFFIYRCVVLCRAEEEFKIIYFLILTVLLNTLAVTNKQLKKNSYFNLHYEHIVSYIFFCRKHKLENSNYL